MAYSIPKTKVYHNEGNYDKRGTFRIKGVKETEKPLMIYREDGEEYQIKSIDFTEATALSPWAKVTFFNKEGIFYINTNKLDYK
jgi:hypothetical protein